MATVITEEAQAGYSKSHPRTYEEGRNPYLHSSPAWMGWEAGAALGRAAYTKPIKATMSRGYSVNVWTAANRFRVTFDSTFIPRVERLSAG
jgi:hypothetical protein